MSKAFTPPSTLTKEDRRTIGDVRRDIWTSGFYGMGIGGATGLVTYTAANKLKLLGNKSNPKNMAMASVLIGATAGSFIMATTTGKNEVHHLHPIYEKGKKPLPGETYRQNLDKAWQRETDLKTLIRRRTSETIVPASSSSGAAVFVDEEQHDDVAGRDRLERQRNRLVRRASLTRSLAGGKGGLSDSHGGRWEEENATGVSNSSTGDNNNLRQRRADKEEHDLEERLERQHNRMTRRESLKRSLNSRKSRVSSDSQQQTGTGGGSNRHSSWWSSSSSKS